MLTRVHSGTIAAATCAATILVAAIASPQTPSPPIWSARAAATYLDGRMAWWATWSNAARDHGTACVSCHTALPYALARPALRSALAEHETSAPERRMLDDVVKRVRLWKEVEPFYPDQTRGLPKTSESRGTEAVLNALILANRDAHAKAATLSDEAVQAFDNMWPLQFTAGDQAGAWAWLNFHYEPWESSGSPYFGASLAAIAVGTAPGAYRARPDIQDRVAKLRVYLKRGAESESLFNRVMVVWASSRLPGILTPDQRQAIVDTAFGVQQPDGGWATPALGPFKRVDGTPLESRSDGFATALIAVGLQQAGVARSDAHMRRALEWLAQHQDPATGMWSATSLNKQRDPASDPGKFMSDAATAYAILALTQKP
jgi:squalene-hopene/tetraprenyl-beta-curcumene cyclase